MKETSQINYLLYYVIILIPTNRLYGALEDEKVLGLGVDAQLLQLLQIHRRAHRLVVDLVVGRGAEDRTGESHLRPVVQLKDGGHVGVASNRFAHRRAVNEIGEAFHAQQVGLLAHHKGDGVHEVGLARAVGSNHGHERFERADLLVAAVGLEVLHLNILELDHFDGTVLFTSSKV